MDLVLQLDKPYPFRETAEAVRHGCQVLRLQAQEHRAVPSGDLVIVVLLSIGSATIPILMVLSGKSLGVAESLLLVPMVFGFAFAAWVWSWRRQRMKAAITIRDRDIEIDQAGRVSTFGPGPVRLVLSPCDIIDGTRVLTSLKVPGYHCLQLIVDGSIFVLACEKEREDLNAYAAQLPGLLNSLPIEEGPAIRCVGAANDLWGRLSSIRLW